MGPTQRGETVTDNGANDGNGWRGGMDVRVKNLEDDVHELKGQVRSIEMTIWKAGGFVAAIVVVIDLLGRMLK